mmetsp:Transcript_24146/g.52707  ORF Transcript_24146/g.52707 Transcript_24146/m.52707 type:complete len:307 (+) Transcript_24146:344-1264(+)|eukprot:6211385-Pleurochrysis_carterae.AAC.2
MVYFETGTLSGFNQGGGMVLPSAGGLKLQALVALMGVLAAVSALHARWQRFRRAVAADAHTTDRSFIWTSQTDSSHLKRVSAILLPDEVSINADCMRTCDVRAASTVEEEHAARGLVQRRPQQKRRSRRRWRSYLRSSEALPCINEASEGERSGSKSSRLSSGDEAEVYAAEVTKGAVVHSCIDMSADECVRCVEEESFRAAEGALHRPLVRATPAEIPSDTDGIGTTYIDIPSRGAWYGESTCKKSGGTDVYAIAPLDSACTFYDDATGSTHVGVPDIDEVISTAERASLSSPWRHEGPAILLHT